MFRFAPNFQEMCSRKQVCQRWKVRYSLLPVTSCWRHIFMFINYGFYRWSQTFVKC